jgi:hypothetical protein
MKTFLRITVLLAVLVAGGFALSLAGGCGSKTAPEATAAVRGRVTFNGKPVVGGLVVFSPDPERSARGKPAQAQTGPDGTFILHIDGVARIPAGWYRVALAPAPAVPDPASPAPLFPAKLARPDLSGLQREVLPGKEHVFEFTVETNP